MKRDICETIIVFLGGAGLSLPDICHFWDTVALVSPVKVHHKVCKFGQNRPNVRILCAKKGTRLKKYTTTGVGVDD